MPQKKKKKWQNCSYWLILECALLYSHVTFFALVKISLGISILWIFPPFKDSFTVKIFHKVSWRSRFVRKTVSLRLTIEKRRSSSAFEWGSNKINFATGKKRLNRFVQSEDVILPIRYHTISIKSAISGYFSFNGDFGISVFSRSWNSWNFFVAHPFPREKIAMLGNNVWI